MSEQLGGTHVYPNVFDKIEEKIKNLFSEILNVGKIA